ncbi:hypothetical protein PoB_007129100 [Plakobranchus ocellatus]|uniref:Uncharacterized protein n=1 Tax=Plakobranchus ocellatus TaxID=259542 RepID=A0AAV4DLD5_9GAST|nr:hypothetical protein PoB_007129100 [Plakobranchus ocellatus]
MEPRIHTNTKRLPSNALKYVDTRLVVDFILNYAQIHAIQLYGRTQSTGFLMFNSCPQTAPSVYKKYEKAANNTGVPVFKLLTFQMLCQRLVPFVR